MKFLPLFSGLHIAKITILCCFATSVLCSQVYIDYIRSDRSNNITLICRRNQDIFLTNADYWINSTDHVLTSLVHFWYGGSQYFEDAHTLKGLINFVMKPEIEGDFYCGQIHMATYSTNHIRFLGT